MLRCFYSHIFIYFITHSPDTTQISMYISYQTLNMCVKQSYQTNSCEKSTYFILNHKTCSATCHFSIVNVYVTGLCLSSSSLHRPRGNYSIPTYRTIMQPNRVIVLLHRVSSGSLNDYFPL